MCSVCVGAGTGDVTAMIQDPQGGQNSVDVMMEDKGDSTYCCTYRPVQTGSHVVTVTFGGVEIPKSPFNVDVGPGELSLRSIVRVAFKGCLCLCHDNPSSPWFGQPVCPGRAGRRAVVCSRQGCG